MRIGPNQMPSHFCNLCGKPIGECEHDFMNNDFNPIVNDFHGKHLAIVTEPADKNATIMSFSDGQVEEFENIEDYMTIGESFFSKDALHNDNFILKVQGESMIEAGINNGDYIIVSKQSTARNGEIVVAMIEGEATVKTFYKEKDHIRLQPENSTMDPIIVRDCQILGKVVGLFRKI